MRRRLRVLALLTATLLVPSAALAASALPAAAAPTAATTSAASQAKSADSPATAPGVEVYASGGGVDTGTDITVTVVLADTGTAPVGGGQATIGLTQQPLATRSALTAWESDSASVATRTIATAATAGVTAGTTATVASVTIPKDDLGLSGTSTAVYGLTATVHAGQRDLTGVGTLVWRGDRPATIGVAAVLPLTVPARADGLITAQDLATYTADDGELSRMLTIAQRNPGLTLAIDPMVLASIRVLGSSAPASAAAWLKTLAALPNPAFPLQYGDADPSLQVQAGLSAPLAPTSFDYAMSAGDFGSPLTVGESGEATPTPTDTATPSPSPSASRLPTTAELLQWPYTLGGIAWPAAGTVSSTDVGTLARAGLGTTIVSGANTNAGTLATTASAALPISGGTALVADDGISGALQSAVEAASPIEAGVANARLNAQLALAAANAPTGGVVLATVGRVFPTDASRAASAMTTALNSPFSRAASLRSAMSVAPTAGLKLVDLHADSSRVTTAEQLLDLEGDHRSGTQPPARNISVYSSVLQNPALLTGAVRNRLLSLFAVDWADSSGWDKAVSNEVNTLSSTLSSVQIVSPGTIRQLSNQALIPITVTNKLPYPVDVLLRVTPSSARLEIDSDIRKTIAAGSSAKLLVPVKAQLGNGSVWLDMQLYSATGVAVGEAQGASVEVHADWEGIGAVALGILVVGFFGFGLFRSIRRRRREKHAAEAAGEGTDG